MLGLLKPALMPIQGSVWSCVRLQQDQSRSNATVTTAAQTSKCKHFQRPGNATGPLQGSWSVEGGHVNKALQPVIKAAFTLTENY